MIISVISDYDNDAGNNPTRTQTQTQTRTRKKGPLLISTPSSSYSSSASRPFWGVNVTPEQPVTVRFRNHRRLHITKAILGDPCLDEFTEDRSVLLIKHRDNPEVYLCSLRIKKSEMVPLDFDLEGPHDIIFTVKGPRGIHLVGYFFDELSASDVDDPPILNNGGGAGSRIEKSLSRILLENDLQGKGIADIVGEPVRKERSFKILLPGLTEVLKQLPILHDASLQPPITKQHELQTEAVSECMTARIQGDEAIVQEDKQQGNSARRKLDLEVQEPENVQVNENEKEREDKRKWKRKNKNPVALPNADRVDGDNDEGEDKRKQKRKNKHPVALPSADRVDGDNDEGSSKPDSPLTHSGKVQKQQKQIAEDHDVSENHGSPQNHVLDSKEAKKLKRENKKQKKQIADDDQNSFLLIRAVPGFERVEKPKKRKAKVVEDDSIRSTQHGQQKDPAQHDQPEDPAQHDQLEEPAVDTREAKKSKKQRKKVVKDSEVRSAQHGQPEDPAQHGQPEDPAQYDQLEDPAQHDQPEDPALDTREAKKSKKRSKKVVKDSEVRSAQHGQPEDPAQYDQPEDPAQHDQPEDPALDTREAKKSKKRSKKVVKDSEVRSAQYGQLEDPAHHGQPEDPAHHGQPEDPAQHDQLEDPAQHDQPEEPALDTREAKKSKKRSKKVVKDSEVRSPTRTSARTFARTSGK